MACGVEKVLVGRSMKVRGGDGGWNEGELAAQWSTGWAGGGEEGGLGCQGGGGNHHRDLCYVWVF